MARTNCPQEEVTVALKDPSVDSSQHQGAGSVLGLTQSLSSGKKVVSFTDGQ